ncbi:MAG: response regulator transcription factor [Pleurocapsa sp. MO_226.B13]|nr:response regulator transcription factor [Pleurocapsa sp. MO_226.B13]
MIRILIVDDQTIVRHGLKRLLEIQPGLVVVGDAENGQEALNAIASLQKTEQVPDVVLLDVRMPIMDGVAATKQISQRFPELKVLVLTTFDDDEYISQAMSYGARGYLLKNCPPKDLAMAIRAVNSGHTHLGPGLFEKALQSSIHPIHPIASTSVNAEQMAKLSSREIEVLKRIATGANNREIGHELHIVEKTVKNHVSNILTKLKLRDRTQAAVWFTRQEANYENT